ncbi:MAG TPA: hypothetical protein VKI44_29685 [Acetobacteraceae bacterium]|nr:hypothetical protein [Acetobacteraceae bacterium]
MSDRRKDEVVQTVSLPSVSSAIAQDGPIEPCVWIGNSGTALIQVKVASLEH